MLQPSSRGGVPKRYNTNSYFVNADKWVSSLSQYKLHASTRVITVSKTADYWERLIIFRNSIHSSLWKYKKEVPCCKIKLGMEKVE